VWLENLIPIKKNNEEIRICVDFRNLNKASLKYNYPLPKMVYILQRVVSDVHDGWIFRIQSGSSAPP